MITNTGKNIVAKYLIGQAPAYASYMAFGCGAEPLNTTESFGDYQAKTSLDFEMFRVPIVSRGYITENGVPYVVFTSELPTEERYEITELGIYSAGANPSATTNDSRTILSFAENEIWEYHTETASASLPAFYSALNEEGDNIISNTDDAFQTNANNTTFSNTNRIARHERSRFLNNIIMLSGSSSDIRTSSDVLALTANGTKITVTTREDHGLQIGDKVTVSGVSPTNFNLANVSVTDVVSSKIFSFASTEVGTYTSGGSVSLPRPILISGNHIHLTSAGVNFSKNSPLDELRLAFSVMNRDGNASYSPDRVSVIVEFSSSDTASTGESAKYEISFAQGNSGHSANEHDLSSNRYVVTSKKLQDMAKTSGFNWANVAVIKIYVSAIDTMAITNKALTGNIATLTSVGHGLSIGNSVVVAGVDSTFNGTYTVTAITKDVNGIDQTFSYAKTASDVASAAASGTVTGPTSKYFIALDAMRMENVTTFNPLYGLTGYTVVRNTAGFPILKDLNTSSLAEFRFGIDIAGAI